MTSTHSKTFCLWLINWLKQDLKNDHNAFCFLDKPAFFSTLDKFLSELSKFCFKNIEAVHVLYAVILLKRWLQYLIKSNPTSPISPEQLAAYFGLCLWISHALWADDVYTPHTWIQFFNQNPSLFARLSASVYPKIPCLVQKRDQLLHQLWKNHLLNYTQDYATQLDHKECASFYHTYQTLWTSKRAHRRLKKIIKNGVYISLVLISVSAIGLGIFWSQPLLFALGVASLVCFSGFWAETAFFHRHPQQR